MSDTSSPNRQRRLSWLVKLVLTVIAGGMLAGLMFWHFASAYNDPLRSAFVLHIATVFFWAYVVATSLCLFDGSGWRKAATKGAVLALVASVVIVIAAALLLLAVALFVDSIIH